MIRLTPSLLAVLFMVSVSANHWLERVFHPNLLEAHGWSGSVAESFEVDLAALQENFLAAFLSCGRNNEGANDRMAQMKSIFGENAVHTARVNHNSDDICFLHFGSASDTLLLHGY